jgi:hypothetical protein
VRHRRTALRPRGARRGALLRASRWHEPQQENAHALSRARHATLGDSLPIRPKRIGIEHQNVPAALACFLDIFRVCLRFGWIGNWPQRRPYRVYRRSGSQGVTAFRRLRASKGLLLPRGPKADELGLTFSGELPPGWRPIAERRKGARRAQESPPETRTAHRRRAHRRPRLTAAHPRRIAHRRGQPPSTRRWTARPAESLAAFAFRPTLSCRIETMSNDQPSADTRSRPIVHRLERQVDFPGPWPEQS